MHNDKIDLTAASYTPGFLLDQTARRLGAGNDAQLARVLEVSAANISRVRNKIDPVTEILMVRILDRTDWTIRQVRAMAGIAFDGGVIEIPERRSASRKLNADQVRAIRADPRSSEKVAADYGVHPKTVSYARKGRTHKQVA